jgi:ATP-dependent 26S proteasome regulatory subunit
VPPAAAVESWEAFADAVLRRAAVAARLAAGEPPRDLAGLYITDDDVTRLAGDLPGFAGATAAEIGEGVADLDAAVAAARAAFRADLAEPASLFTAVAWNAGLDPEEAEVLAFVAAVERSSVRQRLVAYLHDNVAATRPTLGLLDQIFPTRHRASLAAAPDAAAVRACIVIVGEDGPWASRTVSLPPSLAWALRGDGSLDPDLPAAARIARTDDVPADGAPFLLVTGGDRTSRLLTAFERTAGTAFLITPIPEQRAQWDAVVREATVAGLAVVLEVGDGTTLDATAARTIERTDHLAWAVSSASELPVETLPERQWTEGRVEDAEATDAEWEAAVGRTRPAGHVLDREQLRLAARVAAGLDGDIDGAVRRLAGGHLDRLATRIRPRRSWDDVVLPADQIQQLRELTARYRHRDTVYKEWGFRAIPSAGLVALFSGQSGTGKTLTAEIIAGDLGLDLYKVDLSAVVSKYIGETEKNLEGIFGAAAAGNLVLFFDEADALFGKRSEVSDAHDRYANIEVSYLLQRLERYDGIVILATNFQKNIDQAFLRRIHIALEFPLPEEDERHRIWQLSFPKGAPTADIDAEFLAHQFKISGGSIRNAAVTAGFLAAEAGQPIAMEHVMLGLKREFQKLGRLRTAAEFAGYFDLVNGGT